MKRLQLLTFILMLSALSFGQNQSAGQVINPIFNPITQQFGGQEIFRFQPGLVTQLQSGSLFDFSSSQWFSIGTLNTALLPTPGNQLLNFGFGMAHGFGQYDVFKNFDNGFAERFVGSSILYYADYMIGTPLNTGYFGFDYYDRNKKIGIFSLKSFASSLGF